MYHCPLTEFFDFPGFLPENERSFRSGAAVSGAALLPLRSRAARRLILGRVCGKAPEKLVFETGPHGKPFLKGGPHFSVSHCGDRFVIAVCADSPVGVDVENSARSADFDALSRRVMCRGELEEFSRLGATERRAFFIRIWTAKEAALKAAGTGFRGGPRLFDVRGYGPVEVDGGRYRLSRLSLADGLEGAVCRAGEREFKTVFVPWDGDLSGVHFNPPA